MTDNERLTTRCPNCLGPAVVERDWRGEEIRRCDSYSPCPEQARLPEAVQADMGMEG